MSMFKEFTQFLYDAYMFMTSGEDEVEAYRKLEREAEERRLDQEQK